MGIVMKPNTKKRLNAITAKLTPIERQLNEFIKDEVESLTDQELDWLVQAEMSISEAYAFIQQSK
jgi:hypothetical protein